jgi:hypothetical protein
MFLVRAARDALNEEPFTHNAAPHLFSLLQEARGCCFFPAVLFVHWEAIFFVCRAQILGTDTKEPILRRNAAEIYDSVYFIAFKCQSTSLESCVKIGPRSWRKPTLGPKLEIICVGGIVPPVHAHNSLHC